MSKPKKTKKTKKTKKFKEVEKLKEDAICLMKYDDKYVLTYLIEDLDEDLEAGYKSYRVAMRHYETKHTLSNWWYEHVDNIIKVVTPEEDPEYFV